MAYARGAGLPLAEGATARQQAVGRLPVELREALERAGWLEVGRLGTLQDLPKKESRLVLTEIRLPPEWEITEEHREMYDELVQADYVCARSVRRRVGSMGSAQWALMVQTGLEAARRGAVADDAEEESAPPPPGGGRLATRRAVKIARARDDATVQQVENAERARWVKELVKELQQHPTLPAVVEASQSLDPERRLQRAGRGRRATTLRKRVRDWRRLSRWLEGARGRSWPATIDDVLCYLEMRAAEPCGRTCYTATLQALSFMEESGGMPAERRLSQNPLVRGAVDEMVLECAAANPRARAKAHALPVRVLLGWERVVVNKDFGLFLRVYAWLRLVKYWATLRWDDLMWMDPATVQISSRGLAATLARTKVTGPGKTVEVLNIHIARGAYLQTPEWLGTGFECWKAFVGKERRCMLPLPSADLATARGHPAKYADAAAYSQSLFGVLPSTVGSEGPATLLEPGVGAFWTEHSERNGLPSWAASCAVHSDHIDRLGRWGARMSEQYVRSTRLIVERLQTGLAAKIRESEDGPDWADEEQIFHELSVYMSKHGFNDDVIQGQIGRLRYFGEGPAIGGELESGAAESVPEAGGLIQDLASLAAKDPPLPAIMDAPGPPENEPPKAGYVITYTFKRRLRRLHYLGRCYRRPGVDYFDYESYGEVLPTADCYDKTCMQCWPPAGGGPGQAESDDSDEESSSSSASSSGTSELFGPRLAETE